MTGNVIKILTKENAKKNIKNVTNFNFVTKMLKSWRQNDSIEKSLHDLNERGTKLEKNIINSQKIIFLHLSLSRV